MRWRAGSPAGRAAWGGASSDRAVALRDTGRADARTSGRRLGRPRDVRPGWRARPALGASLRLASTAAGTPVFAGATCERVDVELGTARTRVTVGFETGRVARLANGAVVASMGDTVAMCAATTARQPDSDASFFPLSVDYRERASAYGKIPATFTRREGPPKIARCSRCASSTARSGLFPKGFRNETSVQVVVLASDQSQDPAVLAVNGASAALGVSDIPFDGPAGAARVAVNDDGDVVANPSDARLRSCALRAHLPRAQRTRR